MKPEMLQQAIELYDRFTHEGMDRRDFFNRMTLIAGSAAAATSLVAAIAASPAAAAIVPPEDPRLDTKKGPLGGKSGLSGYTAVRKGLKRGGLVLVIHENRGLNPHIEDVARRLALEGFVVVAPDILTPLGGTPTDADKAREMIGKLDLGAAAKSVMLLGEERRKMAPANGKLGIVGFCWGGAFVNHVSAGSGDKLDAAVSYYGPAPDPSEAVNVKAPVMIHHAGTDTRVAATLFPWVAALRAAKKPVTYYGYDGANHAFNNDTSAERYNKEAADLAWARTIRFFKRHLG